MKENRGDVAQDAMSALHDKIQPLVGKIADAPVRTMEGLRAKAVTAM